MVNLSLLMLAQPLSFHEKKRKAIDLTMLCFALQLTRDAKEEDLEKGL